MYCIKWKNNLLGLVFIILSVSNSPNSSSFKINMDKINLKSLSNDLGLEEIDDYLSSVPVNEDGYEFGIFIPENETGYVNNGDSGIPILENDSGYANYGESSIFIPGNETGYFNISDSGFPILKNDSGSTNTGDSSIPILENENWDYSLGEQENNVNQRNSSDNGYLFTSYSGNEITNNDFTELNNAGSSLFNNNEGIYTLKSRHEVFANNISSYTETSLAVSTVVPDVKRQLQSSIKERRKAEGKEDLAVDNSSTSKVYQMTEEEEKKSAERRNKNKESARRSRQNKKEAELKLAVDNKMLEKKNECLKQEVTSLRFKVQLYEKIVIDLKKKDGPHDHQQDPNDGYLQATSNLSEEDNKAIDMIVNDLETLFPSSSRWAQRQEPSYTCQQGNRSGPITESAGDSLSLTFNAEMTHNDDDNQAQVVTSRAPLDNAEGFLHPGYNVGIQENVMPNCFFEMTSEVRDGASLVKCPEMNDNINEKSMNEGPKSVRFKSEAQGLSFVNPLPTTMTSRLTNPIVENTSSSRNLMTVPTGSGNIFSSPWAIDAGYQESGQNEALKEINALQHSPEKKTRRVIFLKKILFRQ